MSRPRFWHRVRFKLMLVSLTLLGIPWAGYRFIQETEQFLREAQAQGLRTTASSVANLMHGEADLFHGVAKPGSVLTFRNLYAHALDKPPQLDGYRDEWPSFAPNFAVLHAPDDRLELSLFLGQHDRHLYLLIGVRDETPAYGDQGDWIELAVLDQQGVLQRYRLQPEAPGWIVARRQPTGDEVTELPLLEPAIRGEWQPHGAGYTVELRLPRDFVRNRLSVRVGDTASGQLLASGRMFPADALGRIVAPSTRLQALLADITPPSTRVWVTDHQGLVLARSGRLDTDPPLSADQPRMPWFVRDLILAVLPRDADTVAELSERQTHLFVPPVTSALSGREQSLRRQPIRGDAVVVSAAVPIRSSEGVRGAVLVEQTTSAILSIQNLALQRLFGVTLVFFAVTGLGLLAFASLLASRIMRLRDSVEAAVSADGRIIGPMARDRSRDEIGDLSRSFESVLQRLDEYNNYLEAMASRLTHELRTPLAVVRGALENAGHAEPAELPTYLDRARDGAERLETTLRRLREATRLEQAIRMAETVRFDLAALVSRQVDGWRDMDAQITLQLDGCDRPLTIDGVPDLVSQALDKLIENARDFHRPGSTIKLHCEVNGRWAAVRVCNEGPSLPAQLDVFQSMAVARPGPQAQPHLGLGLYLVRLIAEYHGGSASADDLDDPPGVAMTLRLPMAG
ncbi:MAG: histidine kinase dimerization/phospho-acceptor domain-containing protein [Chromatiaceae bacterium]|jgi:dedicated sortase system histidine kinase